MNNNRPGMISTSQSLTIRHNGVTRTILVTDPNYQAALAAHNAGDYDRVMELMNPGSKIVTYGNGLFQVLDGAVLIDNEAAPPEIAKEIFRFMEEKLPPEPLVNFVRKVRKNPSYRSQTQMWGFCTANNICITESGDLILYKRVKSDYWDIHTGKTHRNLPDSVVSMPRDQVDEDPNVTCSHGLHVAAWEYAHKHFGSTVKHQDVIVEVEVNPEHVVSIPTDYNNSKMRVCEYKVLSVVTVPESAALKYTPPLFKETDTMEDTTEEYCDECGNTLENCDINGCLEGETKGNNECDECGCDYNDCDCE